MDDYTDDELRVVHRFLEDVIAVSVAARERVAPTA